MPTCRHTPPCALGSVCRRPDICMPQEADDGSPGAQFHIEVRVQPNFGLAPEGQDWPSKPEHWTDADWSGPPMRITVRASNLQEAMRRASLIPFPEWERDDA